MCECDPNEVPTCWEEERRRENKYSQVGKGGVGGGPSSVTTDGDFFENPSPSSPSSSSSSSSSARDDESLKKDEIVARLSRVNFSVSRSDAQSHSFGWSEEGYSYISTTSTTSSIVDDDNEKSTSTSNLLSGEDFNSPSSSTLSSSKLLETKRQQQQQQQQDQQQQQVQNIIREEEGQNHFSLSNVWTVQEGEGGGEMAYVNLLANPEGYTGYAGPAAEKVWRAIYSENCFNAYHKDSSSTTSSSTTTTTLIKEGSGNNGANVDNGIEETMDNDKEVINMNKKNKKEEKEEDDGMCYEERIFFRLISGLQASINTHIAMTYGNGAASESDVFSSGDISGSPSTSTSTSSSSPSSIVTSLMSFFNKFQTKFDSIRLSIIRRLLSLEMPSNSSSPKDLILTPGLEPSVQLYVQRIGKHPDRIKNLYFTFLFVVRAINKARGSLLSVNFSTGNAVEDELTKEMVMQLTSSSSSSPSSSSLLDGFDERSMFKVRTDELIGSCALPNVLTGEEDLAELHRRFESEYRAKRELRESLRRKFHNISRIMDCVGCEKCRLWGKLQFLGLGTAMKVLFAEEEEQPSSSGKGTRQHKQQPSLMHFTRNEVVALLTLLHRLSVSIAAVHVVRDLEAQNKVMQASSIIAAIFILGVVLSTLFCVCLRSTTMLTKNKKRKEE